MRLSGADILVETLLEQGVDTVFGYPGGQIIDVYDSLYKYADKINHILTAHEQGAVHAADGYARTTGRVGVVIATSGPGATNLVTGIATAHMDSVPLVAVCGNVATEQIGTDSFQEIDITGITLPITKHNYIVGSADELADTIREAFRLAKCGRPGPVLIDIPKDVQKAIADFAPAPRVVPDEPISAKDIRVDAAAELINSANRPYIYFGGGLVSSSAQSEMLELADKIDAPIGCSMMGISAIPTDHPRFLGMQGMHGHFAASKAMHGADLVIALGVRFNNRTTGAIAKFAPGAKVVHIDVDGSELSKTVSADVGLRGDIKKTLQNILPKVKKTSKPAWQRKISALRSEGKKYLDSGGGLAPGNIMRVINSYLGENTPVATDVGQHQLWAAQNLSFKKERRFVSSGGLGTMGFGLGAAIGATFATGERSVLITGDGSFGMNLNELATAVKYNVPIVIVILNNGVLGMVRQWQTMLFDKRYSNTTIDRKTDFVALAKAFGAQGERADSIEALDAALERAFEYDGTYVIDCAVDKDEFVFPVLPPDGSIDEIIVRRETEDE